MSRTVQRAMEILEFTGTAPRTLADISERLGVHRTTALRLLQTLRDGGLARRLPDGRWGAGPRLASLGAHSSGQFGLADTARPHLAALQEHTGHTVHLAALRDDTILYIDRISPPGPVRLYARVGRPVPLHTAGVSKAILAHLPPARTEQLIDGWEFTRHTPTTLTTRAAFDDELAAVLERGWATDDEEFEEFVHCVAAPVRNAYGEVMAAVSLTALRAQADRPALHGLVPDVRRCARLVSADLGFLP
ncbi:IclR family transcriptional regulator [Streptomyces sp. NBC_01089]|uniref:IclR family transcriptional regulator n=1 Tax=Streptomyces sp. NBC_01089 TaxID=2903747 RepID=UPI00386F5C30|nr:IclR family transcriptional regulator [Streptomyces sp. NBC_01089]